MRHHSLIVRRSTIHSLTPTKHISAPREMRSGSKRCATADLELLEDDGDRDAVGRGDRVEHDGFGGLVGHLD